MNDEDIINDLAHAIANDSLEKIKEILKTFSGETAANYILRATMRSGMNVKDVADIFERNTSKSIVVEFNSTTTTADRLDFISKMARKQYKLLNSDRFYAYFEVPQYPHKNAESISADSQDDAAKSWWYKGENKDKQFVLFMQKLNLTVREKDKIGQMGRELAARGFALADIDETTNNEYCTPITVWDMPKMPDVYNVDDLIQIMERILWLEPDQWTIRNKK